MEDIKQKLQQLFEISKWSEEDREWLLNYLEKNDTSALQQIMQQAFTADSTLADQSKHETAQKILELIHQKIAPVEHSAKVIRINPWRRIAVAAAIILVVATGGYLLFRGNKKIEEPQVVKNDPAGDVRPGGNKAFLTLSDNSIIVLDSAANGALSRQSNTSILKLKDGQIAYNSEGASSEILYNTVSTPRGGQYQMTLSDGSKVWLNAASSIRFPVAFSGNERKVEVSGEAYFEVVKNAAMPFIVVVAGKEEVEVLGTHFNINAYNEEPTINTTLLEGRVKVTAIFNSKTSVANPQFLSPGEQAQQKNDGNILLNKNAPLDEVMAWKNGNFNFGEGADIHTVMRQVSRWYDIDVEYQGTVNGSIGGSISRNVNASSVFKMMELTGIAKFKIEGKKVMVMNP